jgi:hypothetical protein
MRKILRKWLGIEHIEMHISHLDKLFHEHCDFIEVQEKGLEVVFNAISEDVKKLNDKINTNKIKKER